MQYSADPNQPVATNRKRPKADAQSRITSNPDTMLVKLPDKLMTDFLNIVKCDLITQKTGENFKVLKIIEDKLLNSPRDRA